VDVEVGRGEFVPFPAPPVDLVEPARQPVLRGGAALQFAQHLAQKGASIGEKTQVCRVVAADLGVIHIDMDQFC